MTSPPTVDALAAAVTAGDRASLARAITLVESKRADHRQQAEELLGRLLPRTGAARRIGISGVPGVGKSTFIDALGTVLTGRGHKVAVLAVDPSSTRSGGSILGDKTRMQRLSVDPRAYIRPSPTGGRLGGVARATRETMLLCEAAGFDVVLVETVGTGQSELAVAGMVDFFLALMLPGAGDELQGIKKGILEVADMIAVNKADGDNRARAESARRDYESALRIVMPQSAHWRPPALCVSGLTGAGLSELWARVEEHRRLLEASGELAEKRRAQLLRWMWSLVEDRLMDALRAHPAVKAALPEVEAAVAAGSMPATAAATTLLRAFDARTRTEE